MGRILALLFINLFLFAPLLLPSQAEAHAGPPFLLINGKYSPTNLRFLPISSINIPQDVSAEEKYLVSEPINFSIDFSQLLVPPEIIKKSVFRWSFEDGSTDYSYGPGIGHTYSEIGSHLVTLEAKAPGEDFVVLTTVQLNVVPNLDYELPTAQIAVKKGNFISGQPINFTSQVETDHSINVSSYLWDFGDGTTSNEANPTHTFGDGQFYHFVYLRATDDNGFSADSLIQVVEEKGVVSFVNPIATESAVPIVEDSSFPFGLVIVIVGAVVVLFIVGNVFLIRSRGNKG